MYTYEELEKSMDEYFDNITKEQLIKDLKEAGAEFEEVEDSK